MFLFRLANRRSVNILFKRNSVIAQDRLDKMWRVRKYGLLLEILSLLGVAENISFSYESPEESRRPELSSFLLSDNDQCSLPFLCPRDDSQGALRFAHVCPSVHLSVRPFVTLYGIEFV